MSTRDDLIADWRKRHAQASDAQADSSSQPIWLTRLRLRLYQFLLSLYGDAQWQASKPLESHQAESEPSSELCQAATLQGKPAKDISTIRAALSSVASARSNPNVPGEFGEGDGSDAWIQIASFSGSIDPFRCVGILSAYHISARVISRRDDVTVEVRNKNLHRAAQIIRSNIDWLRIFTHSKVLTRPVIGVRLATATYLLGKWYSKWSFELISAAQLVLTLPLAYAWAAIGISLDQEAKVDALLGEDVFGQRFWLAWRGLFILALLLIWLRAHWRSRRHASQCRPSRENKSG